MGFQGTRAKQKSGKRFVLAALCLVFALLCGAGRLWAQTPEQEQKDVAFVRFVQADSQMKEPQVPGSMGKTYDALAFGAASPYYEQKPPGMILSMGAVSRPFALEREKFYSVVLYQGQMSLVSDPVLENKSKALVRFYNFSSYPSLRLMQRDGKALILGPVLAGTGSALEVSPGKQAVFVYDKEGQSWPVEGFAPQAGKSYDIFFFKTGPEGANNKITLLDSTPPAPQ